MVDDRFFKAVVEALDSDRLTLPTLPDVALRIRQQCENPDGTAAQLSAELARDPAMAARILRVAGSAMMGASRKIDSLQQAITRLGREMTRQLVTAFAVEQAFACKSPELKLRLRSQWSQSIEVAAMARVLAAHFTKLKPDLAMLAGLIHDIGALALIRIADQQPQPPGPAEIEQIIERFSARVGGLVVRTWDFPQELLYVPSQATDFHRWHEGAPDYSDVVSVALLQCDAAGAKKWWSLDRSGVPAFARLGLSATVETMEMQGVSDDFAESRQMLAT